MRKNLKGRLDTDTKDIDSLIKEIRNGEMKVPQFQRPFVWKDEQALDLLDSIASNYPIGSLLLWKTHSKMKTERNIGDFQLPETDDVDPTHYVLDGQQRLTVIYSCLGAPEEDKGFAAAYDLVNEKFVKLLPDESSTLVFPLRRIFDTTKMLHFRMAILSHTQGSEMMKRFDGIFEAITKYKVPVVTLKDLTVEEVCPIFERINSSGTKLSTYDLMVAATWSKTFDLNVQSETIQGALEPKGFDDIDKGTILKCLAGIYFKGVKRQQIFDLRKLSQQEMENLVNQTKIALLKSVDLLSTEFKVYSWDFLPYEALVIVLCYLYHRSPNLNPEQITRVRQWFWRSAMSERYRGASDSFVSIDLDDIYKFVVNASGKPTQFGHPPLVESWKTLAFRSNNSRSRAFVLALALFKPRNLTNGMTIDVAEALSIFNQKEFHHIHPKAHLKIIEATGEYNAIANICLLSAAENRAISDQDPKVYLPQCIAQLGIEAEVVFASNLLPAPNRFNYATLGYTAFLDARATLIGKFVTELCDGKGF